MNFYRNCRVQSRAGRNCQIAEKSRRRAGCLMKVQGGESVDGGAHWLPQTWNQRGVTRDFREQMGEKRSRNGGGKKEYGR